MSRWCPFLGPAVAVLVLLAGCAATRDPVIAEFELDPCAEAIYVPVECCGDTLLFLLDTGASICVFDRSLQSWLGTPLGRDYAFTPGGMQAVELFRPPQATVGGRRLDPDEPVMCADLLMLQVGLGADVRGILGMSFLEDMALELDADAHRVRLLRSPTAESEGKGWPMRLDLDPHGAPTVTFVVGDTTKWTPTLDTGCGFTGIIEYRLCEELLDSGVLREIGSTEQWSLSRSDPARLVVLDSLAVGPFVERDLNLVRSESSALGLPFLLDYKVTMDFPERTLYLERSHTGQTAASGNPAGLAMVRRNGELVVASVAPDSPAELAGVRPGDVILEIQGQLAGAMPVPCAEEKLLVADRDTLKLLVWRDGDTVAVPLDLTRRHGTAPVH